MVYSDLSRWHPGSPRVAIIFNTSKYRSITRSAAGSNETPLGQTGLTLGFTVVKPGHSDLRRHRGRTGNKIGVHRGKL